MQILIKGPVFRLKMLLVAMFCLCVLSGCVTTEVGGVGVKKDPAKALKYSLELAHSYIRQGDWEAAKRHLQNALAINDKSAEIYESLGIVLQNTGEIELAEKNFKKALSLDPDSSRIRNNYAAFLYFLQRYNEAAEQLEIVVKDTLYDKRDLALENLGRCYEQLEEWPKAEEAFRRAYLLDRTDPLLMYELANAYYELGNFPLSQRYYDSYRQKVKQQSPGALWLGIRLAKKFGNPNAFSSYALALKNLYPTSKQYLEYKREFGHDS